MPRYYRRPDESGDAHAWSRIPPPARLVKLPELGTDALPLRELPPHPRLSWRCTRMLAPLVIDAETWVEWFEVRQ